MTLKMSVPMSVATALLLALPAVSMADKEASRAMFQEKCAACHGADGTAVLPGTPSFSKGERMEQPDDALKTSILNGKNAMPPWRGTIPDGKVAELVAYIRTLRK